MLGVIAFSMSMVGTFLVRSGILTSVHAFAVDPARGSFILALLAIYIGGALLLFALRAGTVTEGARFAFVSREAALVFNNVMLCGILGIVLVGTLYPLLTEAFGVKVSVGPPYFNPVSAIFAFPMLVVMAVGPLLRWKDDRGGRVAPILAVPALVALAAGGAALAAGVRLLPTLGLALGPGSPWPAAAARAQPAAHAAADLGHGGQPPGPGRGGWAWPAKAPSRSRHWRRSARARPARSVPMR
jgi:cytochrome c-type biogenesis protein CcmF